MLEHTRLKVPLSSLRTELRTQLEKSDTLERGQDAVSVAEKTEARCANTHSYAQNKNNPQSECFFFFNMHSTFGTWGIIPTQTHGLQGHTSVAEQTEFCPVSIRSLIFNPPTDSQLHAVF